MFDPINASIVGWNHPPGCNSLIVRERSILPFPFGKRCLWECPPQRTKSVYSLQASKMRWMIFLWVSQMFEVYTSICKIQRKREGIVQNKYLLKACRLDTPIDLVGKELILLFEEIMHKPCQTIVQKSQYVILESFAILVAKHPGLPICAARMFCDTFVDLLWPRKCAWNDAALLPAVLMRKCGVEIPRCYPAG